MFAGFQVRFGACDFMRGKRETQKGTRKKEEKETRMKTSKRKIRLRSIRSKELRFTSLPAHEPQGDF